MAELSLNRASDRYAFRVRFSMRNFDLKKIAAPVTARRKRRWKIRDTDSTAWWIASGAIKNPS
jgi:hypothetical protein